MQKVTRTLDVAVIGAGTAGLAAYRAAIAITPRVALIESGADGTTCARVGCMPSKLLLAAGEAAHHARHATPFGVTCTVAVDGRAVMERLRRERDRFVGFVLRDVDRIPQGDRIPGRARFLGPSLLDVEGERIEARAVVIATGSSPFVPSIFDALGDRLVVNDDVFAWTELPRSVAVFGSGLIGLELGQALARLGVRVHVFGRGGNIASLTDPVVRASALAAFREELPFDPDANVRSVERVPEGITVAFDDPHDGLRTETFDYALVAAGRRANLAGLGLENAGLALDPRGIPRFDRTTLQCEDTSIFLAGDVNDDVPVLHEAADEGKIAGANAARYPSVIAGPRRSPLSIVFSDPQVALIGARFDELTEAGTDFVIGEVSFEDQGRARVMLQNRGMCRLYVEPVTGRLLGAELACPRAEHLGHLLAWAHQEKLTVARMLEMPFYHPVIEEGLRTALRQASATLEARRLAG